MANVFSSVYIGLLFNNCRRTACNNSVEKLRFVEQIHYSAVQLCIIEGKNKKCKTIIDANYNTIIILSLAVTQLKLNETENSKW